MDVNRGEGLDGEHASPGIVWFPNPLAAGSQMGTPSSTRGLYICARGVAQNACTRGLHACTDFHKGLAQARTRADIFAQTCTRGWHTCTDFHKKGLAQARTPLLLLAQSQRLAQGACTIAHPCTRACTFAQAAVTWGGDGETLKMS